MSPLNYTLVTDGSSDRVLIPVINWALKENRVSGTINPQWADFRTAQNRLRKLNEKIDFSLEFYPCDILFVHRDAETELLPERIDEIHQAVRSLSKQNLPEIVCLVPVRMQETWLLIDETAIRHAAGNPNGTTPLNLPKLKRLETLPDPKAILHESLKKASELSGRRLKKFNAHQKAHQVAERINDFSPLRNLAAFGAFEEDLRAVLEKMRADR